jgi:hypothetical protein
MWMGGTPPLGYDIPTDATSRALVVNSGEAEVVRDICQRYLRLKSVNALREELKRDGVVSKRWRTRAGAEKGGCAFTTGSLFHLLQSRVYLGEITHRGQSHPGAHPPIVPPELFDAVQRQLAANTAKRRERITGSARPLTGLLFNSAGDRMGPSFAYGKNGKRHAYYVSVPVQKAQKRASNVLTRVAALAFEELVLRRLCTLQGRSDQGWGQILPFVQRIVVLTEGVQVTLDQDQLLGAGDPAAAIGRLQTRLEPHDRLSHDGAAQSVEYFIGVRPVFRGGRTWMVRPDSARSAAARKPDRQLLKALAQAHAALGHHNAAPTQSPGIWRAAVGPPDSYLRRLMPLGYLAPDIQRAILEGRQPAGLTAQQLIRGELPLAWADQRRMLGISR